MNKIRILFIFMIVNLGILDACTLCGNSIQAVDVSVYESHNDKTMKLDVRWDFSKEFSAETLLQYDLNGNKALEPNEITQIHKSLTAYLMKENYLTYIKYTPSAEAYDTSPFLHHNAKNAKTEFKESRLTFLFSLETTLTPQPSHLLYLTFFDKGMFFTFYIRKIEQSGNQENNSTTIVDGSASLILTPSQQTKIQPASITKPLAEKTQDNASQGAVLAWLEQQLKSAKEKLIEQLEDIKANGNPASYAWLLFFSLIYGMIHALGPGHGKSLVSAYFLGNNRSVSKALSISTLIGIVHTFSAFLLTFVVYYVLNTYMNRYLSDIEAVTIKVSAVVIMLIALYLLYKRIPKRPKVVVKNTAWSQVKPSTVHQHSCGCGACQSTSADIGVILSAGIIPCPGTVTVFIFTLSLGVYMVGLMSAVFMSLGMSLVIFLAAYFSLKVREKSSPNEQLRKILDYGSLIFIFGLGMLLFFWSA